MENLRLVEFRAAPRAERSSCVPSAGRGVNSWAGIISGTTGRRDAHRGRSPMPVITERRGRVLVVRLDRPSKRNAIDAEMAAGLDAAMNTLDDDPEIWAGVLTGTDEVFSAGTDLVAGPGAPTPRGGEYGLARRRRTTPLVAAVEGMALGGGFELVLSCDLVVASRTALFGLPEVRLGLVANCGGLFRGPRLLPVNIARELLLTGEPISA